MGIMLKYNLRMYLPIQNVFILQEKKFLLIIDLQNLFSDKTLNLRNNLLYLLFLNLYTFIFIVAFSKSCLNKARKLGINYFKYHNTVLYCIISIIHLNLKKFILHSLAMIFFIK